MEEDVWELVDIETLSLNDLEVLEGGVGRGRTASQLKAVLGRLVSNKTPEEIGNYSLRELNEHLAKLQAAISELAIPKENATP